MERDTLCFKSDFIFAVFKPYDFGPVVANSVMLLHGSSSLVSSPRYEPV